MFYSFKRLVEDWHISFLGIEDHPSVGAFGASRRSARLRIALKLLFTITLIAVCSTLISLPQGGNSLPKLSYLGFGFVLGYWFR